MRPGEPADGGPMLALLHSAGRGVSNDDRTCAGRGAPFRPSPHAADRSAREWLQDRRLRGRRRHPCHPCSRGDVFAGLCDHPPFLALACRQVHAGSPHEHEHNPRSEGLPLMRQENPPTAARCWLCFTPLDGAFQAAAAPALGETLLQPPTRVEKPGFSAGQITAIVLMLICVLIGLATNGLGFWLLVVLAPVLILHAARSETSSNSWKLSVMSVASLSA